MNNEGNELFMRNANHWISADVKKLLRATEFPPGSIVFAKIGAAVFLERKRLLSQTSCLDNNMMGFIFVDPRACRRYFHYIFLNIELGKYVSTTALPSLSSREIGAVSVPVPPSHEQEAIAETLSDVDELLGALETLIAKKRAIKQATMQQFFSSKTCLSGFYGEWPKTALGKIGGTYGGLSGKSGAHFGIGNSRYVTFLGVLENIIVDASHTERVHVAPNESQNSVLEGDLLINGTSETPEELAMGSVMGAEIDCLYLNSFCFGFRIRDTNRHVSIFLAYLFRSTLGRELFSSLAQGATRYNLSKAQFLALEVPLPTYDEQREIVAVLSDLDDEIAALERRRDKTRAVKQGMMQQLLTGRVRLV